MSGYDTSIRVLVVDDHKNMRDLAKFALRQFGFRHVDEADNGVKALSLLEKNHYGLILSDIKMGPMDGQVLLKAVRNDPVWRTIPFIMITADNKAGSVYEAHGKGANHYLVKPFTPASLEKVVKKVLREKAEG